MVPLIDDDGSASDKKPAAKQIYYAIRQCDSLRAPAIFLHWDDCSFYVDNDENEDDVVFAKFDKVVDAVTYITLKTSIPLVDSGDMITYQEPRARKTPLQDAKPAAQSTASAPINAAPVARVDNENSKTRIVAATVTLKDVSFDVRAPKIALLKGAPPPACTTLDSAKAATGPPTTPLILDWENKFQMMKDFKEEFGSCELSVIKKCQSEKYIGLYAWALYWRGQLRDHLQNPADSTTNMDDTRMQRLMQFGFAETEFSNVIASGLAAGLIRKRVARATSLQSPARKKNKTNPGKSGAYDDNSDYGPAQVAAAPNGMARITRGPEVLAYKEVATSVNFDRKLELLKSFKETFGHVNVDHENCTGKFKDLVPFVSNWRQKGRRLGKDPSSKTLIDEVKIHHLTNLGLDLAPDADSYKGVATPILFDKKLELLKSFKIVYGHVNVNTQNSTGKFKDLVPFVSNWRQKGRRFAKDPSSKTLVDEAKVYHLTNLGLDLTSETYSYKDEAKKAQWEHFFKLLTEYKEKHVTCVVSKNDAVTPEGKELLQWYRKQRNEFAKHQDDPTSSRLDEDQNQRLADIGFVKSNRKMLNTRCTNTSWDEMLLQLKAFVEEHGHAEVPWKPSTQLRNWCSTMIQHYDRMKKGKSSHLNTERIGKLVQLGFKFDAKVERLSFDVRAIHWLEYKSKHGREPRSEHMLGQWVRKIRSKYYMLKAGEKTSLTQKQADKLTAWGFKWDSGYKKPAVPVETKSWQERFEELCQYKEKHGHCVVPQQYPFLGQWVKRQRRVYTFIQDGKPPTVGNSLTEERIAKLKDIGFVFLTRKRPRKSSASVDAQKKPYDYDSQGQDGSASDDDEDSEGEIHRPSHESPRAAARGQPWDRYQAGRFH